DLYDTKRRRPARRRVEVSGARIGTVVRGRIGQNAQHLVPHQKLVSVYQLDGSANPDEHTVASLEIDERELSISIAQHRFAFGDELLSGESDIAARSEDHVVAARLVAIGASP